MYNQEQDYRRFFVAAFIAALVLTLWMSLVEGPRRQALARLTEVEAQRHALLDNPHTQPGQAAMEAGPALTRAQRIAASPRVTIGSGKISGSIALNGARFDDLSLVKYRETIDPDSPEVMLFSPNGDEDAYFAQVGWLSTDGKTQVPDERSQWQADKTTLNPGETVTLHWDNGAGVLYSLAIALDSNYMFHIVQNVQNHSGHSLSLTPYAYINRAYSDSPAREEEAGVKPMRRRAVGASSGLHEGPLGVLNGTLDEVTYKDLREKGNKTYDSAGAGWFGITDKYWLSALIPDDNNYKTTFSHYAKGTDNRYQVDYAGEAVTIADGTQSEHGLRLFAGAKEIKLLDHYAAGDASEGQKPIPLFDRAVDFGMLYFLAKPMCLLVGFFFTLTGNFGVAILMLTVVVKLLMFPLANKSYKATRRMQALQPEMQKLAERYGDDKLRLNQEKMELLKREKVNPAAGCLPAFIQMPVFFALLKVLNVSIEMRHAPFFGWIRDLSAPDPSNVFTLFGLLKWEPLDWMHLGLLPILYCITMIIYMRQQPQQTDPTTAKTVKLMPYFLMFVFAKMPAGLVIYWIWSNIISIVQQLVITGKNPLRKPGTQKVQAAS